MTLVKGVKIQFIPFIRILRINRTEENIQKVINLIKIYWTHCIFFLICHCAFIAIKCIDHNHIHYVYWINELLLMAVLMQRILYFNRIWVFQILENFVKTLFFESSIFSPRIWSHLVVVWLCHLKLNPKAGVSDIFLARN